MIPSHAVVSRHAKPCSQLDRLLGGAWEQGNEMSALYNVGCMLHEITHLISEDIVGPRHTLQQRSPHCDRTSIPWSSHGSLLLSANSPTTISWLALREGSGREGMLMEGNSQ